MKAEERASLLCNLHSSFITFFGSPDKDLVTLDLRCKTKFALRQAFLHSHHLRRAAQPDAVHSNYMPRQAEDQFDGCSHLQPLLEGKEHASSTDVRRFGSAFVNATEFHRKGKLGRYACALALFRSARRLPASGHSRVRRSRRNKALCWSVLEKGSLRLHITTRGEVLAFPFIGRTEYGRDNFGRLTKVPGS